MAGMCNYSPNGGADPTRQTTTCYGVFHLTHYTWGRSNIEWPWHGASGQR